MLVPFGGYSEIQEEKGWLTLRWFFKIVIIS